MMKWILGYVTLVLAVVFGKLTGESNKCIPVSDQNFCYFKPGNAPVTWSIAKQLCEPKKSTLPVITNEEEQEALMEYLNSSGITSMVWTSWIYVPGNGWKWTREAKFRQNDPKVNFSRWNTSAPRVYNDSTDYCISVNGSTGTWGVIDCNTNNTYICQYKIRPSTPRSSGIDPSRATESNAETSTTKTSSIDPSRTGPSTSKTSTRRASSIDPSSATTQTSNRSTTTVSNFGSSRTTALNTDPNTTRAFEGGEVTTIQDKSDPIKILSYLAIAIVVIAILIVIVVVTTKKFKKLSTRNMRNSKGSTFDAHKPSTLEDPPLPTDGAPGVGSDANPSTVYAEIPLATIPDANGVSNQSHICYAPLEFHSETPAYATPVKINKNTMPQNSKPTADLYAEVSPQGQKKSDRSAGRLVSRQTKAGPLGDIYAVPTSKTLSGPTEVDGRCANLEQS